MDRAGRALTPEHTHGPEVARPGSALAWCALLTALTLGAEIWGGIRGRSLALLADAVHVLGDLGALLLALAALRLADRPADDQRTYGLHRAEVLAGLANGLGVALLALGIAAAALARTAHPVSPRPGPMIIVGAFGLAINLVVALLLRPHAGKDVNLRGAFLHVASDALASLGVIGAGIAVRLTGWRFWDPAVGLAISGLVLVTAVKLLSHTVNLLLEGVPEGLRLPEVVEALRSVPGVAAVEDVHVWGICSHLTSLSAHLQVEEGALARQREILDAIHLLLRDRFRIRHATLELRPRRPG